MSLSKFTLACLGAFAVTGCAAIASGTNTLTDERIKAETSGALGYSPDQIDIVSRSTQGVNTYVSLVAAGKQEYTCIINGGNILTMGMVNPPMCSKKGEPIKAMPFQ
jgi:hypothetical protein